MSQQNNNISFAATLAEYASNAAAEASAVVENKFKLIDIDIDESELENQQRPRLPREKATRGPLILAKDSDLYILCDGTKKIIKSWITDKEVPNRRLNEKTGYLEKIDPTIEEEDRRLLIPNAILAEDYYKGFYVPPLGGL